MKIGICKLQIGGFRWHAVFLLLVWVAASLGGAATFQEDFSTDPTLRGWRWFGDDPLFRWNPTNQNLEVTWDSSRPNSYFYRPLGIVLAKTDDFSLQFDLRLDTVLAGANPDKPSTFEIAVGFLELASATSAGFNRGSGHNSPNLVEFDYFPAADIIAATVWPTIVSTNSRFNYNGPSDYTILELPLNDFLRITMSFAASNQTLVTTITRNGAPFGPIKDVKLSASFTDFRVDAVSVSSYNDSGDSYGSVFARGTVDNVVVTLPEPPIERVVGGFRNQLWQVQFDSRTNWLYTLERTREFQNWTAASAVAAGTGGRLVLEDTNAPTERAQFYRVRAERP